MRRSIAFTATKAKRFGLGVENVASKAHEFQQSHTYLFGSNVVAAGVSSLYLYDHIEDRKWLQKDRVWVEITPGWEIEDREEMKKNKAVSDEAEKIEAGKKAASEAVSEAGKKVLSEVGKKKA